MCISFFLNDCVAHCHAMMPFLCRLYVGTMPAYHIADPDLLKEILVKHFDKFTNRMVCLLVRGLSRIPNLPVSSVCYVCLRACMTAYVTTCMCEC